MGRGTHRPVSVAGLPLCEVAPRAERGPSAVLGVALYEHRPVAREVLVEEREERQGGAAPGLEAAPGRDTRDPGGREARRDDEQRILLMRRSTLMRRRSRGTLGDAS